MINECKTEWLYQGMKKSISKGMSIRDAIDCIRRRLDIYENKFCADKESSAVEVSSDLDGGEQEGNANVRIN